MEIVNYAAFISKKYSTIFKILHSIKILFLLLIFNSKNQTFLMSSLLQSFNPTNQPEQDHHQFHNSLGQFLKSIIYSGFDATVNTTIIILSGISSGSPFQNIFAISMAAIIAGALDMACCDYVSCKAEISFIKMEEEREMYEVQHMLQDEKKQIVEIYLAKDYSQEDSILISELYATNKQAFVNIMMLEQLSLVAIKDDLLPLKCGLATLVSFTIFGLVTVSPYIVKWLFIDGDAQLWPYVLIISMIELFSLGFVKASLIGLSKWKSAGETVCLGGLATGVGYLVGCLFSQEI